MKTLEIYNTNTCKKVEVINLDAVEYANKEIAKILLAKGYKGKGFTALLVDSVVVAATEAQRLASMR